MAAPADLETYRAGVMVGVFNAIVAAGADEGGDVGLVELQTAVDGPCDAIATLMAAAGVDPNARDRRETADLCRKRILIASNQIAARVAAGEALPRMLDALGARH